MRQSENEPNSSSSESEKNLSADQESNGNVSQRIVERAAGFGGNEDRGLMASLPGFLNNGNHTDGTYITNGSREGP
jgi:hypothetical protein